MDINKEIAYNKRLIKKINIEVNKIKRQPVSFTLSFEEKELKVLKTYLHAFKQLKVKNNIVRSLKRPFQYIEPLLSIKSSLIRHNCFNFKKEIIESCESFLYPSRIFLQDPTQLYPMIDLLEEVCYNCDIKLNQDGVNMWKFIKLKKLKMDETLICEEHTSSVTITETIYNCVVSEIKRNFKSSAKASELIDYAIFLIGKELQNQFLFRMFYDEYYQKIHSNLDVLFPTLVGDVSCKTDEQMSVCLSANGISVISVPDGEKSSFFDCFNKELNKDFVLESKIRYFPLLRLCMVEDGNHRVARAISKGFYCVNADIYDVSILFPYLDVSEDKKFWLFLDNEGQLIKKESVIDIRLALLYKLAKLKSTLLETNRLGNRVFLSSNVDYVKDCISRFIVGNEISVNIPLDYILSDTQADFDTIDQALVALSKERKLSKSIKIKCPYCEKEKIENKRVSELENITCCKYCHESFFTVQNSEICYTSNTGEEFK